MSSLVAQVRNASLARVGILVDDDLAKLELFPVRNGVGTWTLELPHLVRNAAGRWVRHAMAAALAEPGAGIVVALPGGRRLSGPVITPTYSETTDEPRGKWSFTGVTDDIILADRLAFPDPSVPDAQESSASRGYDTRNAPAETLMHAYVSHNIGPASATSRRDNRLVMGADLGRGKSRPKSARFPTLLELCQELAAPDGLNFEVTQVGDKLEFRTSVPSDLSNDIRLDVTNDSLDSATYGYSGPAATSVVVMGQGEAEDRLIVTRTADPSGWDRVIETVVDARGSEELAELIAKGDEVLAANGAPITSLDVVPTAVNARELGVKWWLGDTITVNVAGAPVKAIVSKVRISVGPDGIYAGATVGDAVGFDADSVTGSRLSGVESRVSSLERNSSGAATVRQVTDWDDAVEPGPVWSNNAAHGPTTGPLVGTVHKHAATGRVIQEATLADTAGWEAPGWRRIFTSGWSAWSRIRDRELPDPITVVGAAVNTVTSTTAMSTPVPGISTIDVELPEPAWVTLTASSWLNGVGGDIRAGIMLTGATAMDAQNRPEGSGAWGEVMWASGLYEQRSITRQVKLNAGKTTVTLVAYKAGGSGAVSVNYPTLAVTPLRWA